MKTLFVAVAAIVGSLLFGSFPSFEARQWFMRPLRVRRSLSFPTIQPFFYPAQ
jgi:hypothetical protein